MQASKRRIPGPAGAVLEAQQKGLRLLNIGDVTDSESLNDGMHDSVYSCATLDDEFTTTEWQQANRLVGSPSWSGKSLIIPWL